MLDVLSLYYSTILENFNHAEHTAVVHFYTFILIIENIKIILLILNISLKKIYFKCNKYFVIAYSLFYFTLFYFNMACLVDKNKILFDEKILN